MKDSEQIVYLNGEFIPISEAKISVLDRGFIFGDGVYEVIPAYGGRLFRFTEHIQRLNNSLAAIQLSLDYTQEYWQALLESVIEKNQGKDQSIYLHITRGVAARDHAFPDHKSKPTVFVMSNPLVAQADKVKTKGIKAITLDDNRWSNCHIKAISLLANILLRQEALDANAQEAILIKNGVATEGAASNLFIVKNKALFTPEKSSSLLPGVTRDLIVELALAHDIEIHEGIVTQEMLVNADEIWLTSSTKEILPVTSLNDKNISNGMPGEMWAKLMALYQDYKKLLREGKAH